MKSGAARGCMDVERLNRSCAWMGEKPAEPSSLGCNDRVFRAGSGPSSAREEMYGSARCSFSRGTSASKDVGNGAMVERDRYLQARAWTGVLRRPLKLDVMSRSLRLWYSSVLDGYTARFQWFALNVLYG